MRVIIGLFRGIGGLYCGEGVVGSGYVSGVWGIGYIFREEILLIEDLIWFGLYIFLLFFVIFYIDRSKVICVFGV